MRALTIKQPWVGAILTQGKTIENRSWSTRYRGSLIIHAAARVSNSADALAHAQRYTCYVNDAWLTGHILGIVELVDCVQDHASAWADRGAWHWVLRNPRMLTAPIAIKGKLGLWNLPAVIVSELSRSLR